MYSSCSACRTNGQRAEVRVGQAALLILHMVLWSFWEARPHLDLLLPDGSLPGPHLQSPLHGLHLLISGSQPRGWRECDGFIQMTQNSGYSGYLTLSPALLSQAFLPGQSGPIERANEILTYRWPLVKHTVLNLGCQRPLQTAAPAPLLNKASKSSQQIKKMED